MHVHFFKCIELVYHTVVKALILYETFAFENQEFYFAPVAWRPHRKKYTECTVFHGVVTCFFFVFFIFNSVCYIEQLLLNIQRIHPFGSWNDFDIDSATWASVACIHCTFKPVVCAGVAHKNTTATAFVRYAHWSMWCVLWGDWKF